MPRSAFETLVLRWMGEEVCIVPASRVWRRPTARDAERWLRERVREERWGTAAKLTMFASVRSTSPTPDESELDVAIRTVAQALADGRLVAVRTGSSPPLMEGPSVRPLAPATPAPSEPEPQRPTWISIEFIHETGIGLPRVPFSLRTPDGGDRDELVGRDSKWRADDIQGRGNCQVRLTEDVTAPASGSTAYEARPGDHWLGPTAGSQSSLVAGEHHRVVIVGGSTRFELRDAGGVPVSGQRCAVRFEDREVVGVTDHKGCFVAAHPVGAKILDVTFSALDGSAWKPLKEA